MKHSMTAIAAIIGAAGFAPAVQAQSMTPPGTPPSQSMQSTQYTGQNPSQPYGAQYTPYAAQQQPTANTQWNASQQPAPGAANWNQTQQQPASAAANWNQAQQNGMQQRHAMAPQAGMQQPAGGQISRDMVRQAQEQLREQGLYRGADDGVIGSGTRRAVAQFQRRNGLPVTGSLDETTLSRLSGPSPQGYGASVGQPMSQQPIPQAQAPNANLGTYNANTGTNAAGAYNSQGTPPMQRSGRDRAGSLQVRSNPKRRAALPQSAPPYLARGRGLRRQQAGYSRVPLAGEHRSDNAVG